MTGRPKPPPHVLLRDSNTSSVWEPTDGNDYVALGMRAWLEPWEVLDSGKYGDLEILVPLPYRTLNPDDPGYDMAQQTAEALLNPIAVMMRELAQAAGAGVTATVVEAYERGLREGAATNG